MILMEDPVSELEHDHVAFSHAVEQLDSLLSQRARDEIGDLQIVNVIEKLRDELLVHFTREEEGLFPFLVRALPDVTPEVDRLLAGHDAVCGCVVRLAHSLGGGLVHRDLTLALFDRFVRAYREHARSEVALLRSVGPRLDAEQRRALASLVRGL